MTTLAKMRWETTSPCKSCPYRRDAISEHWHAEEFVRLLENNRNEATGSIYGCHGTRKLKEGPSICAGWLLDQQRRDLPSIQLRMALLTNKTAMQALRRVTDAGNQLYGSIEEMCEANGISLGHQERPEAY